MSIVGNQLDVCVLDFGDQLIDGGHEILSALVGAFNQQRPSVCCEQRIPSSSCPALHFAAPQMRETSDVAGTPRMPKRGEQVFKRESGRNAILHAALQHSTLSLRDASDRNPA